MTLNNRDLGKPVRTKREINSSMKLAKLAINGPQQYIQNKVMVLKNKDIRFNPNRFSKNDCMSNNSSQSGQINLRDEAFAYDNEIGERKNYRDKYNRCST